MRQRAHRQRNRRRRARLRTTQARSSRPVELALPPANEHPPLEDAVPGLLPAEVLVGPPFGAPLEVPLVPVPLACGAAEVDAPPRSRIAISATEPEHASLGNACIHTDDGRLAVGRRGCAVAASHRCTRTDSDRRRHVGALPRGRAIAIGRAGCHFDRAVSREGTHRRATRHAIPDATSATNQQPASDSHRGRATIERIHGRRPGRSTASACVTCANTRRSTTARGPTSGARNANVRFACEALAAIGAGAARELPFERAQLRCGRGACRRDPPVISRPRHILCSPDREPPRRRPVKDFSPICVLNHAGSAVCVRAAGLRFTSS